MNLAEQIELSCLMEATARKPGNVHPAASFADLDYREFVQAAKAVSGPLASALQIGLGESIRKAVDATRSECRSNVNLGIALLIAPLAAIPPGKPLCSGVRDVLAGTTIEDAEQVYAAIRSARPGGLGQAESQDVNDRPNVTLREAMLLAADRDRIAQQYATDFTFVLGQGLHWFLEAWHWCHDQRAAISSMGESLGLPGIVPWETAILRFQIKILTDAPDSLVVRKCGSSIALELQQRAARIDQSDWPDRKESWPALHEFDAWLRSDGHRRNPGTTADLIAATLFAAARDGLIELPSRSEILQHGVEIQRLPTCRAGIGDPVPEQP